MDKRSLDENAVRSECIESLCDDLAAIKEAAPMLREVHIVEAAYRSALSLGWGENDRELKWIFRRVASCLRWPLPREIAP
jgi:hypothetical protein